MRSIIPGQTAKTCSFKYPHRKKAIRVRPHQGGHVIDPWLPIHLHGYVTFNHCCTSSLQCTGAPLCWNHNLYLTATGTPSAAQVEQSPGNHGTAENSTCQTADRGPQHCPLWFHICIRHEDGSMDVWGVGHNNPSLAQRPSMIYSPSPFD
jgi:hypothetical protein